MKFLVILNRLQHVLVIYFYFNNIFFTDGDSNLGTSYDTLFAADEDIIQTRIRQCHNNPIMSVSALSPPLTLTNGHNHHGMRRVRLALPHGSTSPVQDTNYCQYMVTSEHSHPFHLDLSVDRAEIVINLSSDDDIEQADNNTSQPINLSRKRLLRDASEHRPKKPLYASKQNSVHQSSPSVTMPTFLPAPNENITSSTQQHTNAHISPPLNSNRSISSYLKVINNSSYSSYPDNQISPPMIQSSPQSPYMSLCHNHDAEPVDNRYSLHHGNNNNINESLSVSSTTIEPCNCFSCFPTLNSVNRPSQQHRQCMKRRQNLNTAIYDDQKANSTVNKSLGVRAKILKKEEPQQITVESLINSSAMSFQPHVNDTTTNSLTVEIDDENLNNNLFIDLPDIIEQRSNNNNNDNVVEPKPGPSGLCKLGPKIENIPNYDSDYDSDDSYPLAVRNNSWFRDNNNTTMLSTTTSRQSESSLNNPMASSLSSITTATSILPKKSDSQVLTAPDLQLDWTTDDSDDEVIFVPATNQEVICLYIIKKKI